jgi:hypothetical protein
MVIIYMGVLLATAPGELAIDASQGDSDWQKLRTVITLVFAAGLPPVVAGLYFWVRCDQMKDWLFGVIGVGLILVIHVVCCFSMAHGGTLTTVGLILSEIVGAGLMVSIYEWRRLTSDFRSR